MRARRAAFVPVMSDALIASAASAASASAAATSTSTSTSTAAFFTRSRFVDGQRATLVLLFVEPLNGRLCLCVGAHLHKPKPLAAPGFAILDDLRALNCAEWTEQLLQIRAAH